MSIRETGRVVRTDVLRTKQEFYADPDVTGAGATFTCSQDEARARLLRICGTITQNIDVIVPLLPEDGALFAVDNCVLGSFDVRLKGLSGAGVVIPAECRCLVQWTGADMVQITGCSAPTPPTATWLLRFELNVAPGQSVNEGSLGAPYDLQEGEICLV